MSNQDCQKFKMGNRLVSLVDIFGESVLERLRYKFSEQAEKALDSTLRELARYLYLSAYAPNGVFFPGTFLMDDVWHALITETAEYRDLCSRIRPGIFIHHSGLKYEKYIENIGGDQVHAEQSSWLSSYVNCFGPVDAEAFQCLTLAQAMAEEMKLSLDQLNEYAQVLISLSQRQVTADFSFDKFLETEVSEQAEILDRDREELKVCISKIMNGLSSEGNSPSLLTLAQLESLYGYSTATAFCLSQHLAAVERLLDLPDWQERNSDLWTSLSEGTVLCGLATTHLAKPGGSSLIARETEQGFFVSGNSAWVCGYEIFDKLLVGFDNTQMIGFAIIDFPTLEAKSIGIKVHDMIGLNGMGTVDLTFDNYFISKSDLVSSRLKDPTAVVGNRVSRYVIPEIGLGKAILKKIQEIVDGSENKKHKAIAESFPLLIDRLESIELLRAANTPLAELAPVKEEFLRDSVRLLSLATGANALLKNSVVARLQSEVLFLENPVQPPAAIATKIKNMCAGRR